MLLRGTVITSVLTLVSRVLGFVRDLLVAQLLGASLFADIFFVAFRIPNLLRSFVAEGALTSAFVPVFSSSLRQSHEAAQQTFRRVAGFLLYITIPLSILGIVYAPEIVHIFAPGFAADPSKFALCVLLTQMMLPYIACVSLIAMINSALNALQVFGASAWAQVLMNVVLIAGALCAIPFEPRTATILLALSVMIGGFVQILSQFPACARAKLPLIPSFRVASRDVAEVVRLMIPATIGASVYQLTIFSATMLASTLPEGSVSWLFFADRIAQFPVGIFSIALASVLLPALSHASASDNKVLFTTNLSNSLRYTNFVIIPMAAGLWVLALPITQLLFERGAFTTESSTQTSRALAALAVGLWGSSCYSMLVRAFIARKDTTTPTIIGIYSLGISLLTALALMGPIGRGDNLLITGLRQLQSWIHTAIGAHWSLGHVGLALSSSIAAAASFLMLLAVFHHRYASFPWRSFLSSGIRSLVASLCMVAVLYLFLPLTSSPTIATALGCALGAAVYVLTCYLLRSTELAETAALINKKIRAAQ